MLSVTEFAEQFQASGHAVIEPLRFAAALNMPLQELAIFAGVHGAVGIEVPTNAKLRNFVREALRVLTQSYQITRDRERRRCPKAKRIKDRIHTATNARDPIPSVMFFIVRVTLRIS